MIVCGLVTEIKKEIDCWCKAKEKTKHDIQGSKSV